MGKYDMGDVTPAQSTYTREMGERRHLVDSCPIDIYSMSKNPRWAYPFKLMSYWETSPAVADSCESLIIDSGFRRYGDMDDILEAAERYDANYLIPPDITPYFYCYDELSGDSRAKEYARHLRKYERKSLETEVLLPMHRPIDENIDALLDPSIPSQWACYDDYDGGLVDIYGGIAIGLKEMPVEERIHTLGELDRRLPQDTHVHALSPGTELEMLQFLRENPHMVDSLDVSTPESAPSNNKLPDTSWHQHQAGDTNPGQSWFPGGTDSTTLRALESARIALTLNHMLSDLCTDEQFAEYRAGDT